jgi:hypothetical protein
MDELHDSICFVIRLFESFLARWASRLTVLLMEMFIGTHICNEQFSSCYTLLGEEERWSCVYRSVRCLFEFALVQMYRILDVHLLLNSCARGRGRLNRTERIIFHWSISRELKGVIHITWHNMKIVTGALHCYLRTWKEVENDDLSFDNNLCLENIWTTLILLTVLMSRFITCVTYGLIEDARVARTIGISLYPKTNLMPSWHCDEWWRTSAQFTFLCASFFFKDFNIELIRLMNRVYVHSLTGEVN